MRKDQPLWLPPGSIRGLVTLGLVGVIIASIPLGWEVPKEVYGFVGAIIGFYFASRENNAQRVHLENLRK